MDEALNRAIDSALDEVRTARPAPDFLPRLRAHVEQSPAATPIRWWIPFAASATAVIAGVIVAALFRLPRPAERGRSSVTADAVTVAPPAVATRSRDNTSAPQRAATRVRSAGEARRIAAVTTADAVLVPPGQMAVLTRLLDAINAGDEHAASAVRRLGAGTEIEIAPIQIEPVVVPEIKEAREPSSW